MKPYRINLYGGMDEQQPSLSAKENLLLNGVNIEPKEKGTGYRRLLGYAKWDANEVTDATYTGTGDIRGVAYFNGHCYAARNTSNDNKLAIFKSNGSGWTTVQTGLEPNGHYEFRDYAFGTTSKLYGVSGENKAFCIDSAHTYTPITTGLTVDTPSHIAMHRNRMWLLYLSSLLYSDVGDPTAFVDYAAEILLSGEIALKADGTAITPTVGGSLASFARNQITFLSGTGSAGTLQAENLLDHGNRIGAYPRTVEQMGGRTLFLDDQGVTELRAVQAHGDFRDATISSALYPTILAKRGNSTTSCVVRGKSQYRLFYNDGTGLIFSMQSDRLLGITKISFPLTVLKAWSGEDSSGNELILFGSTDGFIYQMESGNSFDGANISSSLVTAFSPCGYPRYIKRFKRAWFDIASAGHTTLVARPIFKLDSSPALNPETLGINASTSYLGQAILGQAILGAQQLQEGRIDMPGSCDYIAMQVTSRTNTGDPWELDGLGYEFELGKPRR